MKPLRSLLYVPGSRPDRFAKAAASGADAVIMDLEDAVPPDHKRSARQAVTAWLAGAEADPAVTWCVRVSSPRDRAALHNDLRALAPNPPAIVFVPKVERVDEVRRIDAVLDYLEHEHDLPPGQVELALILESAAAIVRAEQLAGSARRVVTVVAGGGKDGDVARSLGYRWTAAGLETLHARSTVLLGARAAGVQYPLYSGWLDVTDVDGLRRDAEQNRAIGFTGELVIHPTHVPVVNEVFSPSDGELRRSEQVLEAYARAIAQGQGAITLDGDMIDAAMVATARELLQRSKGWPE